SVRAGEPRSPGSDLRWRERTSLSRPWESSRKPRLRPESGAVSLARRSAPPPIGCAEHRECTERKKGRAKNGSIPCPSGDCAEQRQGDEQSKVARLGVHFPNLKGQRPGCPSPCARVDGLEPPMRNHVSRGGTEGHLSESDRATRCPTGIKPRRGATLVGQSRLAVSTNW